MPAKFIPKLQGSASVLLKVTGSDVWEMWQWPHRHWWLGNIPSSPYRELQSRSKLIVIVNSFVGTQLVERDLDLWPTGRCSGLKHICFLCQSFLVYQAFPPHLQGLSHGLHLVRETKTFHVLPQLLIHINSYQSQGKFKLSKVHKSCQSSR